MSDVSAPDGWELTITAEAEVIPGPATDPDETDEPGAEDTDQGEQQ